jgi:integration host factor subunit alpha
MALTKNDIVNKVNDLGFTKKKSVEVVESLLEIIKGTLSKGDDVLVSGFGKFCVKAKRPRRGRNPATGEDLILRQRKVVTFKCSGKLRDRVNDFLSGC